MLFEDQVKGLKGINIGLSAQATNDIMIFLVCWNLRATRYHADKLVFIRKYFCSLLQSWSLSKQNIGIELHKSSDLKHVRIVGHLLCK